MSNPINRAAVPLLPVPEDLRLQRVPTTLVWARGDLGLMGSSPKSGSQFSTPTY